MLNEYSFASFVGRVDDPTSRIMSLASYRRTATRKYLQVIYQYSLHFRDGETHQNWIYRCLVTSGMITYGHEGCSRRLLRSAIAIIGTAQVENLLSPLFLVVLLVALFFNIVKMFQQPRQMMWPGATILLTNLISGD